jgi:hypothetical protein
MQRSSPIKNPRPASRIFIKPVKYCYTASNLFETILIFYRGACTFRSIFVIFTPPLILDISTPFVIFVVSIATVHPFDLFMTYTKSQLPALWNHLVTVSQSQLCFQATGPVCGCICPFAHHIGAVPPQPRNLRPEYSEEEAACGISAYAQYACLLSLQMGNVN